jgi:hypothetical protein
MLAVAWELSYIDHELVPIENHNLVALGRALMNVLSFLSPDIHVGSIASYTLIARLASQQMGALTTTSSLH